jgi:3-oxoacyl-[acyl-carrier protein] reductase
MDLDLKGKGAIVTGASRGIGRAIAFALAEEGASLAVCSRTEKDIKATAKALTSSHGAKVHAVAWDLTKGGVVERFVAGALKALGKIDILVNNVGAGVSQPFEMLNDKDWQESFDRNLWVALRCCRAALPAMKAQRRGSIINIAALSGRLPRRGQIASNVAKAALINLTESLTWEVGPHGIRVNAICPAAIQTERWRARVQRIAEKKGKDYETTLKALARQAIPIGRFGLPEDVASLVVFLASEKSGFINGASIEVDGGLGRSLAVDFGETE